MSITDPPTEFCTEHTEALAKQNAKVPTIELIGGATINLNVGETYVEKGATAKDEKDGDITNKIQISGSVNTSKAGTYKITYKVKNSSDKETTKIRTVNVKGKEEPKPSTPSSGENNENNTNTTKPSDDDKENTTNTTNTTESEDKED